MFLTYYDLKAKPFQITTDSKFLWLGDKHKEAFATLKYGIWDNKGFLLLTGEVGAGKTTLLNALVNSLNKNVIVARIPDPGLSDLDFYRLVARAYHFKNIPKNKGDFLHSCSVFLNQAYKARKQVLLIVDEAQRISNELLEDIRLLSNIEREDSKLINIFFVGQSEFNEILLDPKNRAIRQRITINYNLETLKEHEVSEYIRYRLHVAGTDKEIFDREAVHEIHLFSGGVPRLINIICDRAMLTGYVRGKRRIGQKIIKECAQELQIAVPPPKPAEEKDSPSTSSASNSEKESGKGKDSRGGEDKQRPAVSHHFIYILIICLLLVAMVILYVDVEEVMQDILISLRD